MPKRTPVGNDILGKIKGFKRFLETVEKQQLEQLVYASPEYFYNGEENVGEIVEIFYKRRSEIRIFFFSWIFF